MGGKNNMPEGWLDYSPLGKQIPGTIIICFKVPLKEEISRNIPESQRFTPSMLIRSVPNLAAVIDVTNTARYYDKQAIIDKGILHEKIQCPGHVVPPARVVDHFQRVMQRMWSTAESAGGKLVGVHCTHGINRTGYLVCRYLIECRGFSPKDAIRLFAESRGHGIERPNYLSDLKTLTPAHHLPDSLSHSEFHKMEEQRRAVLKTDAAPIGSVRQRHDDHRGGSSNRRCAPIGGGPPPPPPLSHPPMPHCWHDRHRSDDPAWHHPHQPRHHGEFQGGAWCHERQQRQEGMGIQQHHPNSQWQSRGPGTVFNEEGYRCYYDDDANWPAPSRGGRQQHHSWGGSSSGRGGRRLDSRRE